MTGQNLAYVALVVQDAEAAAAILDKELGLTRTDCKTGRMGQAPVFGVGRTALALFEPEDPFLEDSGLGDPGLGGPARPGVHHIALAADDPASAARRLGMPMLDGFPEEGLDGAPQVVLDPAATCGVRTRITRRLRIAPSNGGTIERIDHIGVASADNRRAVDVFVKGLGCPIESMQTDMEVQTAIESFTSDKYGVVYRTREPQPVGGLRVAFITVGDCDLEFLQDFDPSAGVTIEHGRPGTTKQDQGAIARFVEKRGAGLHHIALKTPDIDGTLARLESGGHRVIDKVGRPGSRRALIGFLHPSVLGGVLMHFVEREEL